MGPPEGQEKTSKASDALAAFAFVACIAVLMFVGGFLGYVTHEKAHREDVSKAIVEAREQFERELEYAKCRYDAEILDFKNRAVDAGHAQWMLSSTRGNGAPTVAFQWLYNFDPTKKPDDTKTP